MPSAWYNVGVAPRRMLADGAQYRRSVPAMSSLPLSTKTCTRCGETKPVDAFDWNVKAKGYRQSHCKVCRKVDQRELYARPEVRALKLAALHRRVLSPEVRARANANRRKWIAQNPAYRENRLQIGRRGSSSHRARKRGATGYMPRGVLAILSQTQKTCPLCGVSLKRVAVHIDHVVPLALGGRHDLGNLQLLCDSCNRLKSARDPIEVARQHGRLML